MTKKSYFRLYLAIILSLVAISIFIFSIIKMYSGEDFTSELMLAVSMLYNSTSIYENKNTNSQNLST